MSDSRRILVVEDDRRLAELVSEFLAMAGYEVLIEARGDRAVSRILEENPDLVLLDIMLPGLDGLSVCRQVRQQYAGPILMLTALGDEVDEVVGLEVGADDYLAKPVKPRLLLAHINTLLRRTARVVPEIQRDTLSESKGRFVVGDLVVDSINRRVTIQTKELELTTAEFDLLLLLAQNAGHILTREEIYGNLRGIEWDGLDRSIDLRIARLRKKLQDDGKRPQRIKSVRGTGYLLVVEA